MVTAVSPSTTNPKPTMDEQQQHSKRPPLLPSEKDNFSNNQKKTKSRIISSRYMSPSTSTSTSYSSSVSSSSSGSKRYPSPLVSRSSTPVRPSTPTLATKRSVSAGRRVRPLTPDLESKNCDVSAASKLLVTSTRSLSVSFQGETFSLPVSKTKAAPATPILRKGTPERKRNVTPLREEKRNVTPLREEKRNVTPLREEKRSVTPLRDEKESIKNMEQHRWPARNRAVNSLSRSMDCSAIERERSKLIGSGNFSRGFQQLGSEERRPSLDSRLSLDLSSCELIQAVQNGSAVTNDGSSVQSDSDSVSSGSTSGVQESGGARNGRNVPRGIVVSAKFWQETNSRLRRLQDPSSPVSSPTAKLSAPSKLKRYSSDGPLSSPRSMSSPIRSGIRSASPSKLMTPVASSPSRGHSPSRIRNAVSTISNKFTETPSVLSYAVDVRRGKVGESKIVDAHLLRLLYNRHLQWRFVSARSEAVLMMQSHSAEKNLWNAWITISDLRDTVTKKRHRLQLLRQKLKLVSILRGQMVCLEDWACLDKDHSISLVGATEALKATTLRLPIVGGATADVQSLKDAIGSAVDIMHSMASSICSLLPTIEEVNSLVTELAKAAAKERALLEQCTDFISLLAAMQVKDSSLRTHILQHNRISTAKRDL